MRITRQWQRVSGDSVQSQGLLLGGRRILRTLVDGEVAAGASNNVLCGAGLDELETIAKSVSLSNQGVNLNFSERYREFQANHFTDGNLGLQHGRNSRLADVHGVAPNHRAVTRIDPDVDFQLEPGMAASFHKFVSRTGSELTVSSQCDALPD
jgi:hypothetical protein